MGIDNTNPTELNLWDPDTGHELLAFTLETTNGLAGAIAFSPDGSRFVLAALEMGKPARVQVRDTVPVSFAISAVRGKGRPMRNGRGLTLASLL
jgi:hypothetical protein